MNTLAFFLVLTSLLAMAQSVLVIRQLFKEPLKLVPKNLTEVWEECRGNGTSAKRIEVLTELSTTCTNEMKKFSIVPIGIYSDPLNNPFTNFAFDFEFDNLVEAMERCVKNAARRKMRREGYMDCRECLDLTAELSSQITVEVKPILFWEMVELIDKCSCKDSFQAAIYKCRDEASSTLIFQANDYLEEETDLTNDLIENLRKPVDDLKSCMNTKIGKLEKSCNNCLPDDAKIPEKMIFLLFKTYFL